MSAAAVALPHENWKPKANPWLIAVVVSLAAFMEVLDTSIANVALPHIAGNLGASNDQSTWVLTSYLVANAIVLPISGWLVTIFGRKRFFMTCLAIFTVSSLLCGIAPSLGLLLFFASCKGQVEAACSRWCKQSSPTHFLRKNAAWHFRSTESQPCARQRSVRRWADG
jgi:DHA2 family multidrug resistance protein